MTLSLNVNGYPVVKVKIVKTTLPWEMDCVYMRILPDIPNYSWPNSLIWWILMCFAERPTLILDATTWDLVIRGTRQLRTPTPISWVSVPLSLDCTRCACFGYWQGWGAAEKLGNLQASLQFHLFFDSILRSLCSWDVCDSKLKAREGLRFPASYLYLWHFLLMLTLAGSTRNLSRNLSHVYRFVLCMPMPIPTPNLQELGHCYRMLHPLTIIPDFHRELLALHRIDLHKKHEETWFLRILLGVSTGVYHKSPARSTGQHMHSQKRHGNTCLTPRYGEAWQELWQTLLASALMLQWHGSCRSCSISMWITFLFIGNLHFTHCVVRRGFSWLEATWVWVSQSIKWQNTHVVYEHFIYHCIVASAGPRDFFTS